ncbi:MAG: META domain-containing protein, partial [Ilumatobacter sp.]|nr:META domain-containing protein [Ilumatobacter sp.]
MRTRFTLACLTAVALTGCGSDELNETRDSVADVEEPGDDQLDPVNGAWLVDELTLDGQRIALDPSWPITLSVDADTISGTAACNQYAGTIDVSFEAGYGRFVVSDLSWTEMACESPVMELEQAFLSALQAVDSYEAADGLYVAEAGVGTNFHLTPADLVPTPDTTEPTTTTRPIAGLARGGGLDGPVMYAALVEGEQDQMTAEIIGTLELDGDCLYTAFEGNRYPVLWPYGTTWDEDTSTVVLPDGTAFAIGGEVYGRGGYLYPDTIDGLT